MRKVRFTSDWDFKVHPNGRAVQNYKAEAETTLTETIYKAAKEANVIIDLPDGRPEGKSKEPNANV